jgi:Fe-S-cluster containining protein
MAGLGTQPGLAPLDRAEKRRIQREDAKWVGKPLVLGRGARPFEANVRHLVSLLRDTARPQRASEAATFAQGLYERTLATLKPPPVACAKGCAHCCNTLVTIIPAEAFRVARLARSKAGVAARITETYAATSKIPQQERWKAKIPCALLEADICSVHAMRPLTCRGCVSTSADVCFRIYIEGKEEVPPFSLEYNSVCTATAAVLAASLKLVGLPHRSIEWNGALAAAVASADSEERWLAGEDIFAAVDIGSGTRVGTPFDNMIEELVRNVTPTV